MKIVCEKCSAKYSISDDKVKGKVFKIRCKKCGESIVVRGDGSAAEASTQSPFGLPPPMHSQSLFEEETETKVYDFPGAQDRGGDGPIWHIVVDGQQRGPYTKAQIREYLDAGSINAQTYAWREGLEDWLPIQNIQELTARMSGMSGSGFGGGFPPPPVSSQPMGGGLFAEPSAPSSGGGLFDEPGPGGGLFDSDAGRGAIGSSAPSFGGGGGGLFGGKDDPASAIDSLGDVFSSTSPGSSDAGMFSEQPSAGSGGGASSFPSSSPVGGGGGLFRDAGQDGGAGVFASTNQAAAQSPRVGAQQIMMTGQRSENSVLFSLSNLQALAAGPKQDFSAPSVGGQARAELSGLIDIRSLAGSISMQKESHMDDLISMSGSGFAPSLGAPILAAQKKEMGIGVKIGIASGAIGLLAAAVVAAVIFLQGGEKKAEPSEDQVALLMKKIQELEQNKTAKPAEPAKEPTAQQAAPEQPVEQPSAGKQEPAKENADSSSKSATSSSQKSKSDRKEKDSKSSKSESESEAKSTSESEPSSTPSRPAKPGSSELDDLLGGSSPAKRETKPPASQPSQGGAVSEGLSRSQVQAGMGSVAGAVKRCGQGQGGTITMLITIAPTGRVISAAPTGAHVGTPIGLCAAREVSKAQFPRFSGSNIPVRYPFQL